MSVGVRLRFEVFKRDRFTCVYCGRTPPAVLLEIDHVLPRAAGGADGMDNLITSCADCNRGKGAVLLDEGRAPAISRAQVGALEERVAQAEAYAKAMQAHRQLEDGAIDMVIAAWAEAFGGARQERADGMWWQLPAGSEFPKPSSVRRMLQSLVLDDVLEAVDIAAGWADWQCGGRAEPRVVRYFFGVCWRRIRGGAA